MEKHSNTSLEKVTKVKEGYSSKKVDSNILGLQSKPTIKKNSQSNSMEKPSRLKIPQPPTKNKTSKPSTSKRSTSEEKQSLPKPTKEPVKKLPPISALTFVVDHSKDIGPEGEEGIRVEGRIAMCSLPGKVEKEKDKADKFKLDNELKRLQENGVQNVVCLLNKYEMRAFGVQKEVYEAGCAKYGVKPIFYEIVEMAPPDKDPKIFHSCLIEGLYEMVKNGESMAVHCRAGVGRAGLVVACLLLRIGYFKHSEDVIKYLRSVRHHNCVESHSQRRYVKQYQTYLQSMSN